MAEFLIKVSDNMHNDPVKSLRGCYKRGDIVVVMPDGHAWGKEEGLPLFYIVKVPGLSVALVRNLLAGEPDFLDPTGKGIIKRRAWTLNLSLVPAPVLNTLNTTGIYTTTLTAVRNFIRHKSTGLRY